MAAEQTICMKQRLADALKAEMSEKPLDKITVRSLTERCGVNRQTFYYHFDDIYDLLKWIYGHEIIALLENVESADTWKESLMLFFNYLDENTQFCRNTLNSAGYTHLRTLFRGIINEIVKKYILFFTDGVFPDADFMDFLINYYTISIGSVAESYLRGELHQTPSMIVKYLEQIIEIHKNSFTDTERASE